jgi:oligosaccharide repeat unit polymerase
MRPLNTGYDSLPLIRLERLYFPMLACVVGIFVFSGIRWLAPVYFLLAYVIVGLTLFYVIRFWRDYLNPLGLVFLMALIRFSLPGFLLMSGVQPSQQLFQIMGLGEDDWTLGHALALMGLLGLIIGWLLPVQLLEVVLRRSNILNLPFSRNLPCAAIAAMVVGLIALYVFVGSHASVDEAIYTGEIRRSEVQVGTGKYFYLSLMLIASSVVFSAYLTARGRKWWVTLLPAAVAAAAFFVLGGRARAFVPIAAWLLLFRDQLYRARLAAKVILLVCMALVIVFSYVGHTYRGSGVEGVKELFSLSSLAEYVEYAAWLDWGQLHALAGAVVIGPGVLGGRTFLNLLWPLTKLLELPAQSAGILIADTLFGFAEHKWSFHAALIGDAYLNFGLIGVLVVTIIFGAIVKEVYVSTKQKRVNDAIYALIIVSSMRIFFEGVEQFSEMLVLLVFAGIVIYFGQILNVLQRDRSVVKLK